MNEPALSLVLPTHPALWVKAAPVEDIPGQVLPLVDPMRRLMREHGGAGLAASQVGIGFRFFVTRLAACPVAINPSWIPQSPGRTSRLEGCLTWPKRMTYAARYEHVLAVWTDTEGKRQSQHLAGDWARVFQHETDHLNGVCIFPQ